MLIRTASKCDMSTHLLFSNFSDPCAVWGWRLLRLSQRTAHRSPNTSLFSRLWTHQGRLLALGSWNCFLLQFWTGRNMSLLPVRYSPDENDQHCDVQLFLFDNDVSQKWPIGCQRASNRWKKLDCQKEVLEWASSFKSYYSFLLSVCSISGSHFFNNMFGTFEEGKGVWKSVKDIFFNCHCKPREEQAWQWCFFRATG